MFYWNIQNKKTFTLGKVLVKLCILFATKEALSPQAAQKLERIPLSKDTIQWSIEDVLIDDEEQV